jgi:hypothetical protein
MATYDPNQQQQPAWTPPPVPESYTASGGLAGTAQTTLVGDRWAIAALAVVVTTLICCVPLVNCVAPFVPLVVGIITLTKAKEAADPSKARLYGWLATGLGILFVLAVIGIIALYGSIVASLMNSPEFRRQLQRP